MCVLSALQALTSGSNREFSAHGTGEIAGGVLDTDGGPMESFPSKRTRPGA
jgi:hypothetical protein